FSEVAGGGVSAAEILGGAPLALDPNPNTWTGFSFTTTAGPDVAGGVTLQLAAITGGAPGSMSMVCFDNVSVTIPAPVITYPGSGDDLALASAVGIGSALSNADIKTAFAGDVIRVNVKSPMTTYDFMAYSLVGQLVATASGAGSVPGFPEAHLDLLNPVFFMVNGTLASPLGSFNPLLPNVGSMTHYLTPPGLNGSSLIMQAIISDPGANNAFFAATDAHEIQFN
ncbi:MAG: hypothetical protein KDB53_00705, partial [Planctomycetes bacterium]|nr:hypothetical protein [Planctomycetota bacterium]